MAYAADSDVNNRYGAPNVQLWCDMEGLGSGNPNITARRAAGLAWATDVIESRLRAGQWTNSLPLTTLPPVIVGICVKLAGYWYSTARGVKDYDEKGKPLTRLRGDYEDALQQLEDIMSGKLVMTVQT